MHTIYNKQKLMPIPKKSLRELYNNTIDCHMYICIALWKSDIFKDHLSEKLVYFNWIYVVKKSFLMNEEKLYLHVTLYEFRKGVTIETAIKNIQGCQNYAPAIQIVKK